MPSKKKRWSKERKISFFEFLTFVVLNIHQHLIRLSLSLSESRFLSKWNIFETGVLVFEVVVTIFTLIPTCFYTLRLIHTFCVDCSYGGSFMRSLWPELAKFRHFGKFYKVLGNSGGFIYYFAKFWNYFGKFCVPLGKFTFMSMAKCWKIIKPSGHTACGGQLHRLLLLN